MHNVICFKYNKPVINKDHGFLFRNRTSNLNKVPHMLYKQLHMGSMKTNNQLNSTMHRVSISHQLQRPSPVVWRSEDLK